MHLLVEEVDHLLLAEPEGDVADVNPSGLPGDTGPNHGHSGLSERERES